MIDFWSCAEFAALDYRESRDQIDAMERNPKFPPEEILRRRSRLPIKALAVNIVRVVAEHESIRDLVNQQLQGARDGNRVDGRED